MPVKYRGGLAFLRSFIYKNLNTLQQWKLTTIGRACYVTKALKIISFSLTVHKNSFMRFYNIMYIDYIGVNRKSFESSKSLLI
jgi:hypothetical protein